MRFLALLLRRSRAMFLLGLAAGLANGLAAFALIALVHRGVTSGAPPGPWLLLTYAGLCLFVPLSRAAAELALATLGQRAVLDLRLDLADRILHAPLRQLEALGPARLTVLLTHDVATLAQAAVALPALALQLAVVLGGFAYLAWISASVALLVGAFVLGGVWSYRRVIAWGASWLERSRRERDTLQVRFRSTTHGAKELQLHAPRRRAFLAALEGSAEAYRRANLGAAWTFNTAAGWTSFLFFLLLGALALFLPSLPGASRPALAGSALVLLFILLPVRALVGGLPILGTAEVAVRRLEEVGTELARETEGGEAPLPPWERLELAGVEHAYRDETGEECFRLGPLDLVLRRGEITFFVGGNGSGKTTLAKLLAGLYTPEAGELRLDGRPVAGPQLRAWREEISAVFWDFFLFESLAGGEEGTGHLLARLGLDGKIAVAAGRLSTTTALSTGQRRRLALLAAWTENRPVCLFDEWAADQEPAFKEVFYRELLPELKASGKTVFVITHDDRYFATADRVITLADGRVVADSGASIPVQERNVRP